MFNELNRGDDMISTTEHTTAPAPSVWDEITVGLLVGTIAAMILVALTVAVLAGLYWYGTFAS